MSEAVRRKLAALLRMTPRAGCTEAEAMAAAAKAAELMQEHDLSASDVLVGETRVKARSRGRSPRDALWNVVGTCTNTKALLDGDEIVFVGVEPGPSIATYLHVVLNRAIDAAIAAFKVGEFYRRRRTTGTRRAAVADFTEAMVLRLHQKLKALFAASVSAEKRALAETAVAERFGPLVTRKVRQARGRFGEARAEGWAAGNAVDLSHGMTGSGAMMTLPGVPS